MDQRLIVTAGFVAHLVGGGMLAISVSVADVSFTEGQLEFLVLVGYLTPAVAMGLIWAKNYAYGAPLLFLTTGSTAWFAVYTFYVHDGSATVWAVTGDGAGAYLYSSVAVVVGSLTAAGVGFWLWYRESPRLRAMFRRAIRPSNARE